jgi:FtsP/CotA-like multicopper oxidase with cupredoxin domain
MRSDNPFRAIVPVCVLAAGMLLWTGDGVRASSLVPQTPLPGSCIPKFKVPLPVFGPAGSIPRVDAATHGSLTVTMKEIDQAVLPQVLVDTAACADVVAGWPALPASVQLGPTRVWAYETSDSTTGTVLGPAYWPAVTIDAMRSTPTKVEYVNQLPTFDPANSAGPPFGPGLVQGLISVDQTIHWADPLGTTAQFGCMDGPPLAAPCTQPFVGPVPAAVHLHGAEGPSAFDGHPEAWFTPDGLTGAAYRTIGNPGPGRAVYRYSNSQEPGTLWFHDHALGATRGNVYGGMAAFYFLREPASEPSNLPSGLFEIEIAIQDRQFDTNSQLFFPDGSGATPDITGLNGPPPNPDIHPFWNPEFIGDVAIVNGAAWPFLKVEPRRYRFRILNGSNARFYDLRFGPAPVFVIGEDDNYLDAPVPVTSVLIAPGERADVIVDFSALAGRRITVRNKAPIPYPAGLVPGVDQGQVGMAKIMRFKVGTTPVADNSCDPAAGGCTRPTPSVRLTDGNGSIAPGVKVNRVRQLVLKEVMGAGGPVEVLVNNTRWMGAMSAGIAAEFADGISEKPRVGSVELWEIINLTADAHPMHTHLTQFQIVNRQDFRQGTARGYPAAWEAAFGARPAPLPAGCVAGTFCPGYGPPLSYRTPNADGAFGGNPAISPYLRGAPIPPAPEEAGWKDTARAMPGQVLRILVRWTPTSVPVVRNSSYVGTNLFPFDPTRGPGYVWHCHIQTSQQIGSFLKLKCADHFGQLESHGGARLKHERTASASTAQPCG